MHARAVIVLAMVIVVSKIQAAAVLRGVVQLNELGGSPMGNVEVSAVGGNPNNTGVDGQFTFKFPNKNPGDTIFLNARKEGYVVVNDVQLDLLQLPANPDDRVVKIILCKEGDREEMARRLYRLKSIEGIEAEYKKKLEEARNAGAAELAKLRQQRDQAKGTVEKTAEELAKIKPGAGSELYQTAKRLLLDGKVEEAQTTLKEEELREFSKAAKEKKAEAEKATEEAVQNWLLKAHLLTMQFRFDEAEKGYQEAIDTSPESFEANFALALFNEKQHRNDKAKRAYARCLELAKLKGNSDQIAVTLNNLANVDTDQNRAEAARKGYEEALKIFRQEAQRDRATYEPKMAETLNSLGLLDTNQNQPEAARKEFEEALKIRRELAQKNPDTYRPDLAQTLSNRANLDQNQARPEEAGKAYDEAVKIWRELVQKKQDTHYLGELAGTLNNLAVLNEGQNRMEAARKELEEALKIRRELAQKNPDTYRPDLAQTLNNLGLLDAGQNRPEAARKELEEALKIRRELAQQDPETYQPKVAETLNNLGLLDTTYPPEQTLNGRGLLDADQNWLEAARKEFEEALQICRELAQKNPDMYQPQVALTLSNLALVDAAQNRMEEARKGFEEALGIYKELAARNPDQFQSDVVRVQGLLQALNK
jgi:tetratricopeptide (TPR) repeat protein